MDCKTSCFGATAFGIGSLMCMFKDDTPFAKFFNTLDNTQKKRFIAIKKERLMIWLKSTILAVIVSILGYTQFKNDNKLINTCQMLFVYFVVQYLVYSLYPKSDWMLHHINDKKQNKAWLEMYSYMKNRWHLGLVLGLISYGFLSYSLQLF